MILEWREVGDGTPVAKSTASWRPDTWFRIEKDGSVSRQDHKGPWVKCGSSETIAVLESYQRFIHK